MTAPAASRVSLLALAEAGDQGARQLLAERAAASRARIATRRRQRAIFDQDRPR